MVEKATVGTTLVVVGVLLFVGTLVVSAALAPPIGATGGTNHSQQTLIGVQGGGVTLHSNGGVYLVNGNKTAWGTSERNATYFGVTKLKNESVLAGFAADGYRNGCGQYDPPCAKTGFRIIDPTPTPHVVYEWSFPVRTEENSETHDVEPLPNGGFLVADMEHERILIVKHGRVTWQWNASTVYKPPSDPTKVDWLHINDVDRIGKGKYLVSVRNVNQLLVIKRQQHGGKVVEVINKNPRSADGLGAANKSVLHGQHNPQWLDPGAVLVADSGNNRVVELHKNNRTDRWHAVWSVDSANGIHFRWPRDADRLPNGNTLITDSLNKRVVELSPSGNVVWSYRTSHVPYEADRLPYGNDNTYKAPRHTSTNASGSGGPSEPNTVPVLTATLQILKSTYPLPYWLSESQVLIGYVSFALVVVGSLVWLRNRD